MSLFKVVGTLLGALGVAKRVYDAKQTVDVVQKSATGGYETKILLYIHDHKSVTRNGIRAEVSKLMAKMKSTSADVADGSIKSLLEKEEIFVRQEKMRGRTTDEVPKFSLTNKGRARIGMALIPEDVEREQLRAAKLSMMPAGSVLPPEGQ